MDRLRKNIILSAQTLDDNERARQSGEIGKRVKAVEAAIANCKVSFKIWQKQKEDGSCTKELDWTSLIGRDKKVLLYQLPAAFVNILPPAQENTVRKIWKVRQ